MKYSSIVIKIFFLAVLTLATTARLNSQSAAACTSDAQNICTNPTFTFNSNINSGLTGNLSISNPGVNPQMGNGSNPTAPQNSGCLLTNGPGPQWLVLTVATTGNLGFSFGAAGSQYPQAGFYDWAMWAYNPNTCTNIFNNAQAPVACNWNCNSSGGTGMGMPPPAVPGNTPSPCNFQPSIPVIAGQQYIILLSNYSGVTTSVSIANNGTAGLSCNPLIIPSAYVCPGQQAVVTATWSSITNVTYTLLPGGSIQTSPNFTVSAPATQVFTVFAQGLDSVSSTVNASTTFVLNVAPLTPIAVTSATSVCLDANLGLTAALPSATAYAWSGPGTYNSSAQNPVINNVQLSSGGIYVVTANFNFPTPNPKVACPRTATVQVTVIPTSSVTTVPSFTKCEGSVLNLSAIAAGATGYSWIGPGFASSQQNPNINNVGPMATGIYSVTALFNSGGISCTRVGTTTVSIVPTPSISMAVTDNLCQYGTANLVASGPGALSYFWTGPAGFTSTAQIIGIPNIQPVQGGNYYVTATYGIGTQTCAMYNSGRVNVVPVNSVAVNPASASICRPSNASFQANAIGATSYFWSGPNSYTSNTSATTIYYPPLNASGIYTITVSFQSGTLTCYNTNTASLMVNPVLSFSIEPYKQLCKEDSYTLVGPAGASSYTWSGGTLPVSHNKDLTLTSAQPGQSGIYTLSVSLGPCNSSRNTQLDILSPVVYTLTPNSTERCKEGPPTLLQVGLSGGSQNYAYNWYPTVYLNSPTGSLVTSQTAGTTIYNVVGYDIACPHYSISSSFTITVNQVPTPDLKLDKTQGCEPLCLFFDTHTDSSQVAFTTYDFGGIDQMQTDKFYHCLDEPGTYTLNIQTKAKNGCLGTYTYPNLFVVDPKPHSDILWNPPVPNTTENQVTFMPASKYGQVVSYNWMFGGTGIAGLDTTDQKNPLRTYEIVGKYPVMLISQLDNGCIDTIIKILDIRDDFSVYIPNSFTPNNDGNNDVFAVKGVGFKTEGFSMDLYDRWGNPVYSSKEVSKGWDGTIKGQITEPGVYIYKIRVIGANGEGRKEYVGHVTLLR